MFADDRFCHKEARTLVPSTNPAPTRRRSIDLEERADRLAINLSVLDDLLALELEFLSPRAPIRIRWICLWA